MFLYKLCFSSLSERLFYETMLMTAYFKNALCAYLSDCDFINAVFAFLLAHDVNLLIKIVELTGMHSKMKKDGRNK